MLWLASLVYQVLPFEVTRCSLRFYVSLNLIPKIENFVLSFIFISTVLRPNSLNKPLRLYLSYVDEKLLHDAF